jgi:hypothetical protein
VFGTTYGTKWLLFLVTRCSAWWWAPTPGGYRLRPPFRPVRRYQQA